MVTQCYEALVVREHLPGEGALKLAWKDGAGRTDEWLEVGQSGPGRGSEQSPEAELG